MKKRIKWIDTAKFLGIFAIYLGHFGEVAGRSLTFVYQYHVPLFFFLSGCMNSYDKEDDIVKFIKKKFKSIMIPFFCFSIFSLIIYAIFNNWDIELIKAQIIIIFRGNIRNTYFAAALWFLSCLFLMEIIFKAFKIFKKKWVIFLLCLILFIVSEVFISPRPIAEPHWIYNLDSTFYYIVFYAIGYIIYPFILKLFKLDTKKKRKYFIVSSIIFTIYAVLVFFDLDYLKKFLTLIPIIRVLTPIFTALLLIGFNLILSRLLSEINLFNLIGSNSLYLCGNEFIIKLITSSLIELVGLKLSLPSPIHVYLYTMFLLIFSIKIIIPAEKKLISLISKELKIK